MLSFKDRVVKRLFDIIVSAIGIVLTWWIMLIAWIVATVETKSNGFFMQKRIGKDAKEFVVYKIKTMKPDDTNNSTVTLSNDSRITKSGAFLRRTKIDELPQLFNVLFGSMSFVGPRPDVKGFADELEGEDRVILSIRPGITGPASIKYKNEEELLASVDNPIEYNKNVIWRDKVRINKEYIKNYSLKNDILYIIKTVLG
jgi:lipopolysaccharide/colanic/teichoic acid biosynthesis glycosyltransferase